MNKQLNITIGLGAGCYHLQLQSTILETKLIVGLLAMAESPIVGARVPQNWQEQVGAITLAAERKEVEIVRDTISHYLGQINPTVVKGAITALQERVTSLEQKLGFLGRVVG